VFVCSVSQGCQTFFVAYGQNPDKKWPKWLFFEKVMAKITKCFQVISIFIGVSNYLEGSIFFAKKCSFAKEASFYLKTAISAANLKLPVRPTTCLFLSK